METENLNEGQPADVSNDAATAPEDNTTSQGESATLLAGKYKSVEELEKGYRESTKYSRDLNSKIKELENSIPKAPDSYEFNFKDIDGLEDLEISPDDPDLAAMMPVFKELNLTNEQVNTLVSAHLKNMASLAETPDQIKEKLGPEADMVVAKLQAFTDKLPPEDQQIMQALTDTAAGTDFLYRHLIGGELSIPGANQGNGEVPQSSAELFEKAFNFKKEHSNSIGFSSSEQAEYKKLMQAALIAEDNEKKARK